MSAAAPLLAALARLQPLVDAHAAAQERAGHLAPEVMAALHAERLVRLWLPAELSGEQLPLPDALHVFEAASAIDGATGWMVTIGTGGNLFAGYLAPPVAAEVFGPADALIAGSGSVSGTARREAGRYIATGYWRYASGAHHATWFTANCEVVREDGTTFVRAMTMPASAVRIHRGWDAFGMRATGSVEFSVEELVVPESHTFSVFDDPPTLPDPIYRFPFVAVAQLSFAAVALGTARHVLALFTASAGYGPQAIGQPDASVLPRLAEARATLESAANWFHAVAGRAWEEFLAADALSPASLDRVTLASTFATGAAVRAADLLWAVAGTRPVLAESAVGRAWRDLHVVSQHALLSPRTASSLSALFDA